MVPFVIIVTLITLDQAFVYPDCGKSFGLYRTLKMHQSRKSSKGYVRRRKKEEGRAETIKKQFELLILEGKK